MCGIAGYIGRNQISESAIDQCFETLSRRGPDFCSHFRMSIGENEVVLLHTRLSIIDIDARSNQPFTIEHATIVFNGEIYNYLELARMLEQAGITLHTKSDTEILLQYYLKYGEACVDYFEGMWAFAIWDEKENKLFASRDRFGEKPFYYYETEEGFYFASETNALSALAQKKFTKNQEQILRFMVNGHKSLYKHGQTFYMEVKELPFASNMLIDLPTLKKRNYKYWKPEYRPNDNLNENEIIESIRQKLIDSLNIRLRADVPLAFCLSGGVDSASLVSIATKKLNLNVSTFSIIDSDSRYDEYANIEATVKDTGCFNHKVMLLPRAENIERLKKMIQYHDAPIATISYFVHSFLSEEISKKGYKIAISGTGSDEIFSGYYDHFNLHLYETQRELIYTKNLNDWKTHVKEYVRHPYFQKFDLYFNNSTKRDHIYLNNKEFSAYLKKDYAEAFIEEQYSQSLMRNRMMNEMFHEVVPVILHEDDLNSMYYSIENRSPFLDKQLFEFVNTIPSSMLIKDGYAKYLLRSAMKGILNDKVRLDREKKGFNADINSIIDLKNKEHRELILDDSAIFNIVDKVKIEQAMLMETIPNSYKKFLFAFINSKIFIDQS